MARLASRLARANAAVEVLTDGAERYLMLTDRNAPFGGYDARAFAGLPEEIRLRLLKRADPIGVLNLGGVANVTFIDGNGELVACDTGPGNALIDDFVRLRTGQPQDDEGRAAAAGKVDEAAVARVLKHPFFATPPPKSLDRNAFRHWVTEEGRLAAKSTQAVRQHARDLIEAFQFAAAGFDRSQLLQRFEERRLLLLRQRKERLDRLGDCSARNEHSGEQPGETAEMLLHAWLESRATTTAVP